MASMVMISEPATLSTGVTQERVDGAALGEAATIFGSGHAEFIAKNPEQRRIRLDVDLVSRAVDGEFHGGVLNAACGKTGVETASKLFQLGR